VVVRYLRKYLPILLIYYVYLLPTYLFYVYIYIQIVDFHTSRWIDLCDGLMDPYLYLPTYLPT